MILNVLAVGDVVGESGVDYLNRHLRSLKKLHEVHFTVVNGENASGVGILPRQARDIFDAGADVITLGNHHLEPHPDRRLSGGRPLYPAARQLHQPGARPGLGGVRRPQGPADRRDESHRPVRDGQQL